MSDGVWDAARSLGRVVHWDRQADGPPGWHDNPSSWSSRVVTVALALVAASIATWLALFQLGAVSYVWEPFFGGGTRAVLTSSVARAFPVPDAALGALSYLADALFGLVGDTQRWRRHPWVVWAFFAAIALSALTSSILTILQPTVAGAWCTLCLVTAGISFVLLYYAWFEFLASWRWVRGRMDARAGLWEALLGR